MFIHIKSRTRASCSGLYLILFTNKLDPEPPHPTLKPSIKCLVRTVSLLHGPSGSYEGRVNLFEKGRKDVHVHVVNNFGANGKPIELCIPRAPLADEFVNTIPELWERLHPIPWSRPTTTDFPVSKQELCTWANKNVDIIRKLRKV